MRTAIVGVHVVHETEEVFLEAVVVPHGHFQRILAVGEHQVNRFLEQRGAVLVHETHEFRNAAGVAESFAVLFFGALVGECQPEPAHKEGEFAETRGERVVHVDGFAENCIVGVEFDRSTGRSVAFAEVHLRAARDATGEFLLHHASVAAHGNNQFVRECVHAAHAHAVEAC